MVPNVAEKRISSWHGREILKFPMFGPHAGPTKPTMIGSVGESAGGSHSTRHVKGYRLISTQKMIRHYSQSHSPLTAPTCRRSADEATSVVVPWRQITSDKLYPVPRSGEGKEGKETPTALTKDEREKFPDSNVLRSHQIAPLSPSPSHNVRSTSPLCFYVLVCPCEGGTCWQWEPDHWSDGGGNQQPQGIARGAHHSPSTFILTVLT